MGLSTKLTIETRKKTVYASLVNESLLQGAYPGKNFHSSNSKFFSLLVVPYEKLGKNFHVIGLPWRCIHIL